MMMWPYSKTDTDWEQAATTLNPFIAEALSGLEMERLRVQGSARTLAECYVYGAIRYLASYDDLRPAGTGALLQTMLIRHFDADSNEVNECLKIFSAVKDRDKEKLFMMEGAGALRRWLVNNDRTVASDLKDLLVMSK